MQYNDGFKSKLIGTARQVADRILLFRSLGIDFVLTAFLHFQEGELRFPTVQVQLRTDPRSEVEQFGKQVLPLVREGEAQARGLDAEKEIAISGHIYS